MVNNGYISWSCTSPPSTDGTMYEMIMLYEWLESMRKDVELTFIIMKGQFCLLRYELRCQRKNGCDQMWFTCCTLHNMSRDVHGLISQ